MPLTLENHVSRIANEAISKWWNEEARKGPGLEARTDRDGTFKAGIRAALSTLPQAVEAREFVEHQRAGCAST